MGERWSLDLFNRRAARCRSDTFDFSDAKPSSRDTKINVTCVVCRQPWLVTAVRFAPKDPCKACSCPSCGAIRRLKPSSLTRRIRSKLGSTFQVKTCSVDTVTARCRRCLANVSANTSFVYYNGLRCDCGSTHQPRKPRLKRGTKTKTVFGREWKTGSYDQRLSWIRDQCQAIYGDKFILTELSLDHMSAQNNRVPVVCSTCHHRSNPTLINLMLRRAGCSHCNFSRGERRCADALTKMGIVFIAQYSLGSRNRKPFDFYFEYGGSDYVLEYDGQQHFKFISHFHRDQQHFLKRQRVDRLKTCNALNKGFRVIRIDYTQEAQIATHLRVALKLRTRVYLSTPDMYDYLRLP